MSSLHRTAGRPVAHVAAEMRISRPTAHKWVRRWRVEGGLHDRELGWVATNLLLEESLRGAAHAHREVMFQPELVIRATTRRVDGQETDGSAPDAV